MFTERLKSQHDFYNFIGPIAVGRSDFKSFTESFVPEGCNAALYIHVPFCSKRCSFCNLLRHSSLPSEDYAQLMIKEMAYYAKSDYARSLRFQSVYFGGGTPTTLSPQALEEVFSALYGNFNIAEDAEISMETTVTDLTPEKLALLRTCGVNRLSIGVQTFQDQGRKVLGRVGTGHTAYGKVLEAQDAGFDNVNIDLIYNYPYQSLRDIGDDLDKTFSLDLGGFSFYSLIVRPETELGRANLESCETDAMLFGEIYDRALANGFSMLELTKLVRHDRYQYIQLRHSAADILAIGAGAGGSLSRFVYHNPSHPEAYRQYVDSLGKQEVPGMFLGEQYRPLVRLAGEMQQCRLSVDKYADLLGDGIFPILEALRDKRYLWEDAGTYVMTKKGVYWGNNITDIVLKNMFVDAGNCAMESLPRG